MDVVVRPVNVNGKPQGTQERKIGKAYTGKLLVRQERLNEIGRSQIQAELVSKTDGMQGLKLPPLADAHLVWLNDKAMRISGMEVIEDIQYYQTWEIEVVRA